MLNDIKRDCVMYAKRLGDYETLDTNYLADSYCEAKDKGEYKQNYFFCALVLRFWYVIYKLFEKSPNLGLEIEDYYCWLVEAIEYACKYRAWQDPTKHISAQACINQCINTIRLQHYYEYNLDKSKANFGAISLDNSFSDDEAQNTLIDTLVDEKDLAYKENAEGEGVALSYIQSYINKNKLVEAIILDTIAFNDTERQVKTTVKETLEDGTTRKYTEVRTEFWAHKLIQILGSLPDDFETYFISKYKVNQNALEAALEQIRKSNNQKLYKYLRKCLETCRADFN